MPSETSPIGNLIPEGQPDNAPGHHDALEQLKQAGISALVAEIPDAIHWAIDFIKKLVHAKKSDPNAPVPPVTTFDGPGPIPPSPGPKPPGQ